ncbi:MAG TPA: alpha/beta hydrolase, partial [Cyclobacteriaceae bacterium]|nr:alpha/beta hydrolase [Cyclobacteriaceae bacterium]
LKTLKRKVALKASLMAGIDTQDLNRITNLFDFDNAYTARLHGFAGALDYYERCSSLYLLNKIKRPTLLVNACNDPFLSEKCYPQDFKNHSYLFTEYPKRGGHVGFAQFNKNGVYWSELRALQFIQTGT